MKIVSLNVNGFFNGQDDSYDFDKLFEYIKTETNRNNDIIFCLQEFRVRKNDDVLEDIKRIFDLDLKIVLNCMIYNADNFEKLLSIINDNKELYTVNLILIKSDNRLESGGTKYGEDLEKAPIEVKYRFAYCRVWTKDHYFYIFNLHLISSKARDDLIGKYMEVLNKIVNTSINKPDCNLLIGDFNYAKNEDRQMSVNLTNYYKETEELLEKINNNGFFDLWKKQHKGIKDFTYYYENNFDNGRRLDYIYASKMFCEKYNENRMFISHEPNILWDKHIGFTDHSALVLTF